MKNKLLYLTMAEVNTSSGVYKKIRAQADAFERQGFETRILFVSDTDNIHYLKNGELREGSFAQIESEVAQYLKECSFCYARFELLRHKYFKRVLNLCIAANTKIVTEIPTFPPYQESFARAKAKLKSGQVIGGLKTMVGAGIVAGDMNALANMSSMVCIVADDFKFKKTKTIRIENGIDLQKNPLAQYSEKNVINIIAVSNFAVWNGYDRAVEGLGQYYATVPKRKVHLTFVGPLDNAPELQKRIKELGLDNEVTFTGALSGAALDEQYANADIALGALGNHRRKVFANSSLKAKEYAARGMMMVLSDAEGIEKEILDNSFVVKSDESPIDFESIVKWFDSVVDKELVKNKIHEFAVDHYAWDSQMKKVLSELNLEKQGS